MIALQRLELGNPGIKQIFYNPDKSRVFLFVNKPFIY